VNHNENKPSIPIQSEKFIYTKQLIHLVETESTNKYAMQLLKDNPTDCTAIVTDYQTAGKGQMGNVWVSEKGKNILLSLIWRNSLLKADDSFQLNKAVTYAIHQFLKQVFGIDAMIKWPNDIVVGYKKISGILTENSISGNLIKNSVIGLGLNINQTDFPEAVSHAVSVKLITQKEYALEELIPILLGFLNQAYELIKLKQFNRLTDYYIKNMYRLNEKHPFIVNGVRIEATIVGVNRWGKLIILHNSEFKTFATKEIEFVY